MMLIVLPAAVREAGLDRGAMPGLARRREGGREQQYTTMCQKKRKKESVPTIDGEDNILEKSTRWEICSFVPD